MKGRLHVLNVRCLGERVLKMGELIYGKPGTR